MSGGEAGEEGDGTNGRWIVRVAREDEGGRANLRTKRATREVARETVEAEAEEDARAAE